MYCQSCGSKVKKKNAVFCESCGSKLSKGSHFIKDEVESDGFLQRIEKFIFSVKGLVIFIVVFCLCALAVFLLNRDDDTVKVDHKLQQEVKVQTSKESKQKEETKTQKTLVADVKSQSPAITNQQQYDEGVFSSDAEDVVEDYLEALDVNDYRRVYNLMSPRKKNEVGEYNTWVQGFTEPDTRIMVNNTQTISINGNTALVRYRISVRDHEYDSAKYRTGVARVVRVGTVARVDDINNQ